MHILPSYVRQSLCSRFFLTLFAVCFAFLAIGCEHPEQPKTSKPSTLQTQKKSIINGKVDFNYNAVGALSINQEKTFCTVTLISPRHVLTAAHCVEDFDKMAKKGQTIHVQFDILNPGGKTYKKYFYTIHKTHIHPQYSDRPKPVFDLAIIELDNIVQGIQPIAINIRSMGEHWIGTRLTLMGYGFISADPQHIPTKYKRSAVLPVTSVAADRFGTNSATQRTCHGDSGGPALFIYENEPYLMGVTSYSRSTKHPDGGSFCDSESFSMRVDISYPWMKKILSPQPAKPTSECQSHADCGPSQDCRIRSEDWLSCVPGKSCKCVTVPNKCKSDSDCSISKVCRNRVKYWLSCTSGESCRCIRRGKQNVGESCSWDNPCKDGLICFDNGKGKFCLEVCTPQNASCSIAGGTCSIRGNKEGLFFCGCKNSTMCGQGYMCQSFADNRLSSCLPKKEQPPKRPNPPIIPKPPQKDKVSCPVSEQYEHCNAQGVCEQRCSSGSNSPPPQGLGCQIQAQTPGSLYSVLLLLGLFVCVGRGRKKLSITSNR